MKARLPDPAQIRSKLLASVGAERRDALLFSILTIVLTPAFVALAVFITLVAVHKMGYGESQVLWDAKALVHGTTMFLLVSCGAFFVRPDDHPGTEIRDLLWLGLGVVLLAIILLLTYVSELRTESPRVFWPLYGGLVIATLGLLGRGYVPRDHYYVRPGEWSWDDSPVEREIEQAGFWFGFASAFPGLILGSYGNIFGSGWLWQGLSERGAWLGAEVLHALGARDAKSADGRLRAAPSKESGRVVRWLVRLKYIRRSDRTLELTSEGERFLGISEWTV